MPIADPSGGVDEATTRRARREARMSAPTSHASNMALVAVSNLAVPAAAFLTAPVLARVLSVDGRGNLAAATAPFLLITSVALFGMPGSLLYFTALKPLTARRNLKFGLSFLLAGGVFVAAISWFLAPWLSDGNGTVADVIRGLCLIIPGTIAVSACQGVASGLQRWNLVAAEKIVTAILRTGGIYALAATGHLTVKSASISVALPAFIAITAYIPLFRLPNDDSGGKATKRDIIRYAMKTWLGLVSGVLLMRLDQAILAPLAGAVQLGYYTVAANISEVTILPNYAMRDVTSASDASNNNNDRVLRTARISLILSTVAAVVLAISIWFWFNALFGQEFRPAIAVTLVLLVATACGVPGSVAGAALGARGMPGARSASLTVALVINALLIITLAPMWGAMGAAVASVVGSQVASQLNILWFTRRFGGRQRDFFAVRSSDVKVLVAGLSSLLSRR